MWRKNHTFAWRICNIQITNTLRTLREGISNGFQCCCKYVYVGTINRTPTADDGLPNVSQRIANAWRIRICGHDKSDPYGCEQIAKTLLTDCHNAHNGLPKHIQHKNKNTTIVHHPTVTYFIKHTYSLTLIHIIYNIMHIFNCLREHLDNTKTAETYLNINLLKICKRLIFFTL